MARQAGVKTPHVFHCITYIGENPRQFCPDTFAIFAGLERRHVDRIVSTLQDNELLPKAKARQPQEGRGTRLPAAFSLPDDWLSFAQSERRWDQATIEATFQEFIDYWHAQPGQKGVKLDWFGTWRNWCRRSRTPNGSYNPNRAAHLESPEAWRAYCENLAASFEKIGRDWDAEEWRAKAGRFPVQRAQNR